MSKRKVAGSSPDATGVPARVIETLIRENYKALLESVEKKPTIGELIRMIELYRKMAPGDQAEKELWADLDKIRKQVLGGEAPTVSQKKPSGRAKGGKKKND